MWWAVEGRGRKGVTLNLRRPEGQELFRRLAAHSDVVCENFRPGTLEGWHIGPDDVRPPSWCGPASASSARTAPTPSARGSTGWASPTAGCSPSPATPTGPRCGPGVTISDYLTGTFAAEAVVCRPLPTRPSRTAAPDAAGWSTPPSTAPSSAPSSGRWPAHDRLGIDPRTSGQPPGQLRPSRQLRDGRRSHGLHRGRIRRQLPSAVPGHGPARAGRRPAMGDAQGAGPKTATPSTGWLPTGSPAGRPGRWRRCAWPTACPIGLAYDAADIIGDPHMAARGDLVRGR